MLNEKVVFSWRSEIAVKKYVFPLLVPTVPRGNAGRDAPASRFQKAKKVMIVQGFCPWTDTSGGFAPVN
jgi:hypothetical protein